MSVRETTRDYTGQFLRLLLVSAVSLLFLSLPVAVGPAGAASTVGERVTVYFFHRTVRCETCLFIETLADATLRAEFPEQLSSGTLVWRPLDVNLPENSRLVADFGLRASDLVVVWENARGNLAREEIPNLWELAADPERLSGHVKDVVERFLEKRI